jgi:hypothetical protein
MYLSSAGNPAVLFSSAISSPFSRLRNYWKGGIGGYVGEVVQVGSEEVKGSFLQVRASALSHANSGSGSKAEENALRLVRR